MTRYLQPHTVYPCIYTIYSHNMDSQTIAIAIDRLKFYAKDAAFTLSQVGHIQSLCADSAVYLQTVRLWVWPELTIGMQH
jgi:hypothetical protein